MNTQTFWRLAREPFQELDGEGARLYGGRWNSIGTPVVYTSSTLSLATLEMLVHVDPEDLPKDLVALRIAVSGKASSEQVRRDDLPDDWADVSDHPACREVGDAWVSRGTSLVLRVPSAIIWEEESLLVDPRHPDFEKLQVVSARPFRFDRRLVG